MMRTLVARGMLAGLLAGVLATAFAFCFAEPSIESAIAVEQAQTAQHSASGHTGATAHQGEPVFGRGLQSTAGLFTGITGYAVAAGGLFALAFAALHGRVSTMRPRTMSAALAVACYVAVVVVPFLKYPANPPAVGSAATIDSRTALYFGFLAVSVLTACTSVYIGRRAADRWDGWHSVLLCCGGYTAVMAVVAAVMPTVDEVSQAFPGSTLWSFRIASLGTNLVLWLTLGLAFGPLVERVMKSRESTTRRAETAVLPPQA